MPSAADPTKYVSVAAAARHIGVSPERVRQLTVANAIPYSVIPAVPGGRAIRRYYLPYLDLWMQANGRNLPPLTPAVDPDCNLDAEAADLAEGDAA